MGWLQRLSNLWHGDTDVDNLAELLQQVQDLFQSYGAPMVLGCTGTTAVILWQLGWYKLLLIYLLGSTGTLVVVAALFYYLNRGVADLRDREELTTLLLETVRELKRRRKQRKEAAAEAGGSGGEDPMDKCV